ncbi:MAG: TRAP transporter small permease [Betaproteobacteria bacterium]|nr:TRAP transporter small permease [Betaproteobacteria bacterium]
MNKLGHLFAAACGALVLFMMGVTTVDVALRYFLNAPLKGAFEMTEISMAMVIFGGMSLAAIRREHITVDLLESKVPRWARRWQRVAGDLVCALAVAVLGWRIWVRGGALLDSRETTLVLGVPRGYVAYAMAVLCVVAVCVFAYCAWRDARAPEETFAGEGPQGTAL